MVGQSMIRSFSSDKMRYSIWQNKLLSLILFTCGFFAVQRFTITPLNTLVCALPFCLFLVQIVRGHHRHALTFLLIALFLSIDNGGSAYAETIAPLRYGIYTSAIAMLFYLSERRIQRKALLLATLLGCSIAFGSATNVLGTTTIDATTLQNNILVLFILSAFLIKRGSVSLDLHILFSASFGYLVGEVINVFFFFRDFTEYLSYDSLKAFVIFPFIYTVLTRRSAILQAVLAMTTLYIIFLYGTRMITLTLFALITGAMVIDSIRNRRTKSLLGFSIAFIALATINPITFLADTDLMQFKSFAFLVQIKQHLGYADIYQILTLLDPVRFAEHQLFFDRPLLQVIFGSGIGSGIYDANGVLAFVNFDQTAFSEQELISSTFYNLHDFWIDYGLRFGILPIAYLIYQIVLREMHNGRLLHGILFGTLLLNTTFATSGLLLTALMVKFSPRTLEN